MLIVGRRVVASGVAIGQAGKTHLLIPIGHLVSCSAVAHAGPIYFVLLRDEGEVSRDRNCDGRSLWVVWVGWVVSQIFTKFLWFVLGRGVDCLCEYNT